MSEFRDAIARCYDGPDGPFDRSTAAAVLASPEMQAIRQAFNTATAVLAMQECNTSRIDVLNRLNLPESVIAWVLDEGSNG